MPALRPGAAAAVRGGDALSGAGEGERRAPASLSVGLIALLPLFAAYEWSVLASGGRLANVAERLLALPLAPLGAAADLARLALVLAAAVLGLGLVRARGWELGRSVLRVVGEGLAAGIALGPILLLVVGVAGPSLPPVGLGEGPIASSPPLERTAFVFGGAAYEELVFRVGVYGLVYLLVLRLAALGDEPTPARRLLADALGLGASAFLFATFHLAGAVAFLGGGGEPFHAGLFAWRFAAGLLLGALFRWRGPGVAGWAHGLFNASLVLGAGPGVFEVP